MPISCQFNLQRGTPIFYNGEQIVGSFTLAASRKSAALEGISIRLLGSGEVHWSQIADTPPIVDHNDSSAHSKRCNFLSYEGARTFVDETHTVSGAVLLPAESKSKYKFHFELPAELPASCKLPHGEIQYALLVSLERRTKHAKVFKQRLTLKNRIEVQQHYDTCAHNCNTASDGGVGGGVFELRTTKCGYVPGQRVSFRLSLRERAAFHPAQYVVKLCQCIEYRAATPQPQTKRHVRILDSRRQQLQGVLHIPLTTPIMSVFGCELLCISYYVMVHSFDATKTLYERQFLPLNVGTVGTGDDANCVANCGSYVSLKDDDDAHAQLDDFNYPYCFVNLASSLAQVTLPQASDEDENSCASRESVATSNSNSNSSSSSTRDERGEHHTLLQLKQRHRRRRQSHIKTVLHFFY